MCLCLCDGFFGNPVKILFVSDKLSFIFDAFLFCSVLFRGFSVHSDSILIILIFFLRDIWQAWWCWHFLPLSLSFLLYLILFFWIFFTLVTNFFPSNLGLPSQTMKWKNKKNIYIKKERCFRLKYSIVVQPDKGKMTKNIVFSLTKWMFDSFFPYCSNLVVSLDFCVFEKKQTNNHTQNTECNSECDLWITLGNKFYRIPKFWFKLIVFCFILENLSFVLFISN